MGWSVNPEYKELDKPWAEHHNSVVTQATIRELLKDGTPDWISHPKDYRRFAEEAIQANKEISNDQVESYKMSDQELLIDFKARNVNIMSAKDFVLKLRDQGIKCWAIYVGMQNTAGLWVNVPTTHGGDLRYITFVQTPAMIEWDVLRLDEHNLPAGLEYRGWRSVVVELIKKGILSQSRADAIFGRATDSLVSRRYRRSLFEFRHRTQNVKLEDGHKAS